MKPVEEEKLSSKLWFSVLVLFNSLWIFYAYFSVTHMGVFEPAKLSRALLGTAEKPYVYRVLMPLLAKILAPIVPVSIPQSFLNAPTPIKNTFEALSQGGYAREAAVILALMFLSLVGFPYAEKNLLYQLGADRNEQYFLPLFAQILILPFSLLFGFYYDLPQILLITITLVLMLQARWFGYLIVFVFLSLNKETSLFVIFVFIFYYLQRMPLSNFLKLLGMQTLLYSLIRGALLYLYRNNAGTSAVFTFSEHYRQYTAYPSTLVFTILFFLVLGALIWKGWNHKHAFLKASLPIPLLILVSFFVAGMPMEFRVFLDALPTLTLLIIPTQEKSHRIAELHSSKL